MEGLPDYIRLIAGRMNMIRRILVPLDGSELADSVLPVVIDLAKGLHAKIHLVQAFEIDDPVAELYGVYGLLCRPSEDGELGAEERLEVGERTERREYAEGYLSRVAGSLEAQGLQVSWEVVEGKAVDTIVELAQPGRVDLVAMSTHERSGLDRAVFGSVAEEVMRKVEIPVLLVKPD